MFLNAYIFILLSSLVSVLIYGPDVDRIFYDDLVPLMEQTVSPKPVTPVVEILVKQDDHVRDCDKGGVCIPLF